MRMFEQGVLDEALRHAIGLSDLEGADGRLPSLRDAGARSESVSKEALERLVALADAGALRTDFATMPKLDWISLRTVDAPVTVAIAAGDRGALPVFDAVLLAGGRTPVAVGETGIRLLTNGGRTVTHWDQPTERLVVADQGTAPSP